MLVKLRHEGEIREFNIEVLPKDVWDENIYKDKNTGLIDRYNSKHKIEFKLSGFSKFTSIDDVYWLKKFKHVAGEIFWEVEDGVGSYVTRWLSVEIVRGSVSEKLKYDTRFGNNVPKLRELKAVTLTTTKYVEIGVEADALIVEEVE
jgi:hypothetical protein